MSNNEKNMSLVVSHADENYVYVNKTDSNGTKQIVRLKRLTKERIKEYDKFCSLCYHTAYVDNSFILEKQLKNNDVFRLDSITLFSNRGYEYYWEKGYWHGEIELKLIDEKTGECVTTEYLKKLSDVESINDVKRKNKELEKMSVNRRSIIEYKLGNEIRRGIVLTQGVGKYVVISLEDFNNNLHKKDCSITKYVVDKKDYSGLYGVLDESKEELLKKFE